MTTKSTSVLDDTADGWEAIYPSAVCSGIVGDAQHQSQGGYHISYEDNPNGNYSIVRVDDKPPNMKDEEAACAIDMSMSDSDMKKCWDRVYKVWKDHSDPRRKYFNAFNGWDGSGDASRLDFVSNSKDYASPDHKWHSHSEGRRRYVHDNQMKVAWLSVFSGESKEDYEMSADDIAKGAWRTDGQIRNKDFYWRTDSEKHNPPPGTPENPTEKNDFIMGETAIVEAATQARKGYETAMSIQETLNAGIPIPGQVNLTPECEDRVAKKVADMIYARMKE